MSEHLSRKQNELVARKNSLLNEIKYYELKIKEESSALNNNNNAMDDDSSDSECEFTVEVGLSTIELKLKQQSLTTCLQATQELAGLEILQSKVDTLLQDPVLQGERPVTEEGVWREVLADCRIDLVPFTIYFYVHKPSRMFGPMSYRTLHVSPVKTSHEKELAKSVLKNVNRPSDAIEIIRNYSAAHRSRRTTMARLADKYGGTLFMVAMEEGGYKMTYAGLLEVQWILQNNWSPLAPFQHKMVFDLEYMDETYIKIISTLHKMIIDPTIDTDDRTLLLSKIIDTCLEAKAHTTQNQAEVSMELESEEAQNLKKRRTTLDQEPEQEPERNRKKDSEVMAPPKSLPKKSKLKAKVNKIDDKSKPVKRTADDAGEIEHAKKPKTAATDKPTETKIGSKTKSAKTKRDKVDTAKNTEIEVKDDVIITNSEVNPNNSEKILKKDKNKNSDKASDRPATKEKVKTNNVKESNSSEKGSTAKANKDQTKERDNKVNLPLQTEKLQVNKYIPKNKQCNETESKKKTKLSSNIIKNVKAKQNYINDPESSKSKDAKSKKAKQNNINDPESSKSKDAKSKEVAAQKLTKDKKMKAPEKVTKKIVENKENENKPKPVVATKVNKEKAIFAKVPNAIKNLKDISKKPATNIKENYLKNSFPPKAANKKSALPTKIPRISPRKLSSIKSGVTDISKNSGTSQKSLQKVTNIPRLLKKPQTFETNKV